MLEAKKRVAVARMKASGTSLRLCFTKGGGAVSWYRSARSLCAFVFVVDVTCGRPIRTLLHCTVTAVVENVYGAVWFCGIINAPSRLVRPCVESPIIYQRWLPAFRVQGSTRHSSTMVACI